VASVEAIINRKCPNGNLVELKKELSDVVAVIEIRWRFG